MLLIFPSNFPFFAIAVAGPAALATSAYSRVGGYGGGYGIGGGYGMGGMGVPGEVSVI